jgi:hypothetical protein
LTCPNSHAKDMTTIGITALSASDQFISTQTPCDYVRAKNNEGHYTGRRNECFSPVPHDYSGAGSLGICASA